VSGSVPHALRESDAAAVGAFVREVCTRGVAGDGLAAADVTAVKFEYFFEDLALIAYRVARGRFGDKTAVLDLGSGRAGLVDGAAGLPDGEFGRCVARLTEWVVAAWRSCEGIVPRGFLGPHDDLFMVDLDVGPPPRLVDFDRWDDGAAR
jgi:hypothetical protein